MTTEQFKLLVIPFAGRIHRVALTFLKSDTDAEDVVQEVLIKLWNHQHKLSEIRNVEAFAVSITRNLCIDKLRSYRYRNQVGELDEYSLEGTSTSPEGIVSENQLRGILKSCINELSAREQEVYRLREFEQLEFREIESILEIDQTTVRVTLSRARKKVQTLFFQKTGLSNE